MRPKYLKEEACGNCGYLRLGAFGWTCDHNKPLPESRICELWVHFAVQDESANENYTEPQSWEGGFADNH